MNLQIFQLGGKREVSLSTMMMPRPENWQHFFYLIFAAYE
jgi:hypothetical protein